MTEITYASNKMLKSARLFSQHNQILEPGTIFSMTYILFLFKSPLLDRSLFQTDQGSGRGPTARSGSHLRDSRREGRPPGVSWDTETPGGVQR